MLSGTRLGDDAFLTHLLCQEYLTDGVVNFVSTGVVQIFALQIQLATVFLTHALCQIEGRWSADVVAQQGAVLVLKLLGLDDGQILFLQFLYRSIENLGYVSTAEFSVKAFVIY